MTSCDWTTCYDDIGFIDYVIKDVSNNWCIDMNMIHLSGISNGGMFAYFVASQATDALGLATINPMAAASLVGFGTPPPNVDVQFSIIDMHGILDETIPYNETTSEGT